MYIPNVNRATDREAVIAFMRRYSFATLVTARDGLPVATHLPFAISLQDEAIRLKSHVAKANDQWRDLEAGRVLVIFSEPHAYISTRHYDHQTNVPTWNYVSVHAYGKGRLLTQPEQALQVVDAMIGTYEADYRQQWEGLPEAYRHKMLNGIVAFEVRVTELQAKEKLSQNRSAAEQGRIIDALASSDDSGERSIAEYMQRSRRKG